MKLLIGTLVLSLSFVACGKNASMARREKSNDLNLEKISRISSDTSIDGTYVSLQPKGHIDDEGKEVISGHILNHYLIKDGKIYGNEIDLEEQTFTSFINVYSIDNSKKHSEIKMRVDYLSCGEDGKSLRAGVDDMGVLEEEFSPEIKLTKRGLVLSLNGQKESLLKVSEEESAAISAVLMSFELLIGEKNNCSKQSAKLDRAEESMDVVQEFLDVALDKKVFNQ